MCLLSITAEWLPFDLPAMSLVLCDWLIRSKTSFAKEMSPRIGPSSSSLLNLSSCGSCIFLDTSRGYFNLHRVVVSATLHSCKIPLNRHVSEEYPVLISTAPSLPPSLSQCGKTWKNSDLSARHSYVLHTSIYFLFIYLLPWWPWARYFNPQSPTTMYKRNWYCISFSNVIIY